MSFVFLETLTRRLPAFFFIYRASVVVQCVRQYHKSPLSLKLWNCWDTLHILWEENAVFSILIRVFIWGFHNIYYYCVFCVAQKAQHWSTMLDIIYITNTWICAVIELRVSMTTSDSTNLLEFILMDWIVLREEGIHLIVRDVLTHSEHRN